MQPSLYNCLAILSAQNIATIRLTGMLTVLAVGLISGYLAANRFAMPEHWAKKIMTVVLVFFNWPIALLVIWPMQLSRRLVWMPIICIALMLTITVISLAIFYFSSLDRKGRLTVILAGGLSNMGYTGGAFVCYALFGTTGLALANIYPVFWMPVVSLIFFPLLKLNELHTKGAELRFSLTEMFDARFLVIPAVIAAIILNLASIKPLAFVEKFYIIDILVYTASALAFFAIGLRVKLPRLKEHIDLYFPLAAVKFIITPAVAFLMLWLLALAGQELAGPVQRVIIVLSATPSAVLMVTMSNVFDLDGPLASALWVVTMAIFVVIVVPVFFFFFT